MIVDASDFIGAEVFSLLHRYGYSIEDASERFYSKDTMINEKEHGIYKVALRFRMSPQNPSDHLTGSKLLAISKIEDQEEIGQNEELESGRISANLVFGGSMDSKVFDLPINDKLYKSKYKHLVIDNNESFPERETLFYFFRHYTISDEERKQLWRIRIGNSLGITRELYDSLCLRLEIEGIKKQYHKLIGDDLFRTLPNYGNSRVGDSMYQKLHHILSLFQLYRPEIGYVQGMSFLVVMIYYFYDEYETFSIFTNLIITKPLVFACYDFDIDTVSQRDADGDLQIALYLEAHEESPQSQSHLGQVHDFDRRVSHRLDVHYIQQVFQRQRNESALGHLPSVWRLLLDSNRV